ncbi:hypothetical protein [Flammeovirga aprica]|uniref:Uncharacterized protein n=1 Tax=Flammeovirga aprica JL-4 TaxID=694437 RepID=A0A7X9RYW5_9BACT|nr:hypothetical protein [Flammeovirga aprica]NME71295.1 hypothetical protein [Flammeovirga aprica JL-4]
MRWSGFGPQSGFLMDRGVDVVATGSEKKPLYGPPSFYIIDLLYFSNKQEAVS